MATYRNDTEESITLQESCSIVNNISAREVQSLLDRHSGRSRRKWPFRSIGSSSILLILTWKFIICCSLAFPLYRIRYFHFSSRKNDPDSFVSLWLTEGKYLIGIAVVSTILLPVISLLAQVLIGGYKFICYSLRILWILSIIASIISIFEESIPMSKTTLLTIQLLVILIPSCWIFGAFLASAVPLGLDQITGGSAANISAFIQWLGWGAWCALATSSIIVFVLYNCTYFQPSTVSMIMSLLPVLLLSVGLILDFHFHHKLVKEPVTVNPVSLIFKVLKYAAKHKYPVQRSAFTYCENEQPTRLDYGKSKYGGSFTTEQVEDVKTFGRVLVTILALSILFLPLVQQIESASIIERRVSKSSCLQAISYVSLTPTFTVMFSIPLYELLIYPFLRHRGPSILQSAGIGAAALIVSSVYGIIAETTRETLTNSKNECMFTEMDQSESTLRFVAIPFIFLLGATAAILYKSSIEFICAQAPYNMISLLIGHLFQFSHFIFHSWSNIL